LGEEEKFGEYWSAQLVQLYPNHVITTDTGRTNDENLLCLKNWGMMSFSKAVVFLTMNVLPSSDLVGGGEWGGGKVW
jgi:hypothetical protein